MRARAEEQYLREVELPPRRGRILDRNGAELASTADVDSIYCNPRQLPDPRDAARRLARVPTAMNRLARTTPQTTIRTRVHRVISMRRPYLSFAAGPG